MHTIQLQEQMKAMYLTSENRILGIANISTGGQTQVGCDPRIILMTALKLSAIGIIIAHNHPSGNIKPSQQDITFTKRLKEVMQLLDIKLLDHLILSKESYHSMEDDGLI